MKGHPHWTVRKIARVPPKRGARPMTLFRKGPVLTIEREAKVKTSPSRRGPKVNRPVGTLKALAASQ